ncbi:HPr family phosphocarrier protein [Paenibacillus alvei]|uniref:HPr family phosphocarrier protein n=2 Tax=Paenibacillus alvei TaxID=44250 RepID=A0AAP7A4S7_PAEAL|nr:MULTISPECIES: HPr family phosphocarrier protein [Paenibacillus]EJW19492.1 phosphotransferase system HPr family protein [Paenibacillus alvei DSM 29]EPY06805.1 phosphotransferase system, phosphocarrier protein HPr [Paenibacillus alvei TS-15]MBG9735965.1 dihydroxyacetone kinase [Paenibacillus alvei]MBG9742560.1 dihydroxyacetone kinase [Paenibacillus alvei]MCY7485674.1 HPr family phosphocarrier protein [Paenibacillus alvei]
MEKQFTIKNPQGIHARPAGAIMKKAAEFAGEQITIEFNGRKVSAKSITGVLTLGMKAGDTVTVSAEGEKAAEAVEAVGAVIESVLD